MSQPPFQLNVGGRTYSIHSDTAPEVIQHLALLLDRRIQSCDPQGRMTSAQALLYAALTLVDDLEKEKRARQDLQTHAQLAIKDAINSIDAALLAPR
ncbi:MAG TPA: cell division protein ZapA [Polyangiaceae bacterium]